MERPFCAPHHNASLNSLVGGGSLVVPGEISLAHNGILFINEIAEFDKKSLDDLRQPMEDKVVTVSRVNSTGTFPANFMLVAAMNPCPCGYHGQSRCRCSDYEVLKYMQKLSGQSWIGSRSINMFNRLIPLIFLLKRKGEVRLNFGIGFRGQGVFNKSGLLGFRTLIQMLR